MIAEPAALTTSRGTSEAQGRWDVPPVAPFAKSSHPKEARAQIKEALGAGRRVGPIIAAAIPAAGTACIIGYAILQKMRDPACPGEPAPPFPVAKAVAASLVTSLVGVGLAQIAQQLIRKGVARRPAVSETVAGLRAEVLRLESLPALTRAELGELKDARKALREVDGFGADLARHLAWGAGGVLFPGVLALGLLGLFFCGEACAAGGGDIAIPNVPISGTGGGRPGPSSDPKRGPADATQRV